jgi:clan AA aspartic protease (TIGR02281 family)
MQGENRRLQQMMRPMRRSLAALALFLALPGAMLTVVPAPPAAAETIQLKKHAGGGFLIPGRVNDAVAVTFILDTGASDVLIPDEVARELESAGKLDRGDFIGTRTYVLADGSKIPSRRVLLRQLTVGDVTVSNVTANIGRPGSPPLLGQSFLSKFASWTLDNERNQLVLKTKGDASAPAAESGIRLGGPGGSYGAFAHDDTSGRYGASWNQSSQARADEAALKGCASEWCKIVFRITAQQCGAIAMTDNGKIWGGATRSDRDDAQRAAIANCEKRTGGGSCRVRSVQCNR